MNFDKRFLNKKQVFKNVGGKIIAMLVVTTLFNFTGPGSVKANVGIGTSTPGSMLTIVGASTTNAFSLTGNFNQVGVVGASGVNGSPGSTNVFVTGNGGAGSSCGGAAGGMCFFLGCPACTNGNYAGNICGGNRSIYCIIGACGAGATNANITTAGCAYASAASYFSLFDTGICGGYGCSCCGNACGGAGPGISIMGSTGMHCGGTARATTGGTSYGGPGGTFGVGSLIAPRGGDACGTACNMAGRGFNFSFGGGCGGNAIGGTTNCGGGAGGYTFNVKCGGCAVGTGAGNLINYGGNQGSIAIGVNGTPGSMSPYSGGMACGVGACMFGGSGSCIIIVAQNGGCAVGGSVSNCGGAGGDIHLIAGMGGTGATANGRNGNIIFWSCNTEVGKIDNANCRINFGCCSGGSSAQVSIGANAGLFGYHSLGVVIGSNAGCLSCAYYDVSIGSGAGAGACWANCSVMIGYLAGNYAVYASDSQFIGYNAGMNACCACQSNFIGREAGAGASLANNSNFLGKCAGYSAYSAYNSNFLGCAAGYCSHSASCSNFLGYNAGSWACCARGSNFFGYMAGYCSYYACEANFFGHMAGAYASGACYSNFFGLSAGNGASSAYCSNFIGPYAGYCAYSAYNSNFIGLCAGSNACYASNSIFIGTNTGCYDMVNNYNGATSIAIGNFSGTGGFSDSVAIGRGVKNSSACEMNLGNVLKLCNIYKCDMQSSAFMTGATVDAGCNIFKAGNIILAYTTVPPSPVAGQIYFNGTNFFGYNGITWKQLDN